MKDHSLTDWCDLARGVADPATERRLRTVLSSGSSSSKTLEMFQRVAAVAAADREMAPPEHAVRVAKAIGSLRPSWAAETTSKAGSFLRRLTLFTAFDSWLQPAPMGTRDLQSSHRQLLFQSDDFAVDLRLEHEDGTVVVGQLVERLDPPRPVADVPVLLVSEGRIVATSLTSPFGEFLAENLPSTPLNLWLLVGDEECLDISLEGFQEARG